MVIESESEKSSKLESISESLNSSLESSDPSEASEHKEISLEQLNINLKRGEDRIFGAPEDILLDEHSPLPDDDENSVSDHSESLQSTEVKEKSEIEEDIDKLGDILDLPELDEIKKKAGIMKSGISSKNLAKQMSQQNVIPNQLQVQKSSMKVGKEELSQISEYNETEEAGTVHPAFRTNKTTKTQGTIAGTRAAAKREPRRPFQAAPNVIDLSNDTPFELKWAPIKPHKNRKPIEKRDPEDIYQFVYDRRIVDRGLFQDFEDQGEKLRAFPNPDEATKQEQFWLEEQLQTEDAKDIVKQLRIAAQYDYFKLAPAAYNLSIQYEREMQADAKKQARAQKKKALEEAAAEGEVD